MKNAVNVKKAKNQARKLQSGADGAAPSMETTLSGNELMSSEEGRFSKEQGLGEELDVRTAGMKSWREGASGGEQESPEGNPLLKLEEEDRARLYTWLRECPYEDAVKQVLREQGIGEVSSAQLMEFFQIEAENHWEKRISRAAIEANALVQLVERSPIKFSSGILVALGQEAFRQIASGQVEPASMGRIATLFLKARSDERADQMGQLKREKLRRDLEGQIGHALEKLAEEVEKHPAARAAFEALRKEIQESAISEEEGV